MKRTRRADGPNEDEIRKKEGKRGREEGKVCVFGLTLIECGESCIRYVGKCTVGQDMKPASQPGNILKSEKRYL